VHAGQAGFGVRRVAKAARFNSLCYGYDDAALRHARFRQLLSGWGAGWVCGFSRVWSEAVERVEEDAELGRTTTECRRCIGRSWLRVL
jgi:hypothetical protein